MHIKPFDVEIWMNSYENKCQFNLAETCVESISISQLLEFSGKTLDDLSQLFDIKMTYGAIQGSQKLRTAISHLYEQQLLSNIITTHGAIGANALVYHALIKPEDKVVSIVPTYQQHTAIPQSIGAHVNLCWLKEENHFLPDLGELEKLVSDNTKLIAITNPNNPTGSLMDEDFLLDVIAIAKKANSWILCDEVYRGTNGIGNGMTRSIVDMYEKGISTCGMSKAFSLAGLRLGWITAPENVIEQVMIHRDYNTISVSQVDEYLAALALENYDKILARSQDITRENRAFLDKWVTNEPTISWVSPPSGTTALLKYENALSSEEFCKQLLDQTGVLLLPGSAMAMEGYVRIGYANNPQILRDGLEKFSIFLGQNQY